MSRVRQVLTVASGRRTKWASPGVLAAHAGSLPISAHSQYPSATGTTSSSTNFRTAVKCDHCSPVNCSRTEKKSVPSASPRWVLMACVIAGSLRL